MCIRDSYDEAEQADGDGVPPPPAGGADAHAAADDDAALAALVTAIANAAAPARGGGAALRARDAPRLLRLLPVLEGLSLEPKVAAALVDARGAGAGGAPAGDASAAGAAAPALLAVLADSSDPDVLEAAARVLANCARLGGPAACAGLGAAGAREAVSYTHLTLPTILLV